MASPSPLPPTSAPTPTFTFHSSTIPVLSSILATLTHILHLAEESPIPNTTLLTSRIHESMLPLPDQIRIVTQFSATLLSRLTSTPPTPFTSPLTSFAEFHERIESVQALLATAENEIDTVNANGDRLAPTVMGAGKSVEMSGATYAHFIALPNIYFHLVTAYDILRKEGVELTKLDYYRGFLGGI